MNRQETLETAIKTITQDRQNQYGAPENSFAEIAKLWSVYLDVPLTAHDVAMLMSLLKIARIKTGEFKPDNYIDLAGYAACACEITK